MKFKKILSCIVSSVFMFSFANFANINKAHAVGGNAGQNNQVFKVYYSSGHSIDADINFTNATEAIEIGRIQRVDVFVKTLGGYRYTIAGATYNLAEAVRCLKDIKQQAHSLGIKEDTRFVLRLVDSIRSQVRILVTTIDNVRIEKHLNDLLSLRDACVSSNFDVLISLPTLAAPSIILYANP